MRTFLSCASALLLLLLTALGMAQDKYSAHIAKTEPRSPEDEKKAFRLPPGFEAQLVAAEPDIHKPLNMAFDDRGRLWVTETVEYPFAAEGRKPRDAVKVLEDFGPDGKARKITTFADGLNIPIGVLPLPNAGQQQALVFSIPNVNLLTDAKGAGQADQRKPLYSTFGYKDTHGMTNSFTLGLDGWVYACHGFSNTSTIKGSSAAGITMQSGNVYRMRPDGSQVQYFTHGQVNPFGIAPDPLGNLYTTDCHTRPIYQLLRGAWYPSFGKPHDGLGFGPEMLTHSHGSTALCGIVYYAADQFPKPFHNTIFIGNVVTNRINHDRLEWRGSSPVAVEQPDFMASDDPWFRPVDLKLGPDGAIYIADFYNRIIGHYEVPLDHPGRDRERGRIWRIVYRGTDGTRQVESPERDLTRAAIEDLIGLLGHANLTVRLQATHQLAARGGAGVIEAVTRVVDKPEASKTISQIWQRCHGLWVLQRCGALQVRTLAAACGTDSGLCRVHGQKVLADRLERLAEANPAVHEGAVELPAELRKLAEAGLEDNDPQVQRAAADALGRWPSIDNIRPLLDLLSQVPGPDTHLRHVVRMALRDQLVSDKVWSKLRLSFWTERDGRAIADVSLGVPTADAAAYLLRYLTGHSGGENMPRYVQHASRYGKPEVVKGLLALAQDTGGGLLRQVSMLRAIEKGTQERGERLGEAARTWSGELADQLLAAQNPAEIQAGIELVGALRLARFQEPLAKLAVAKATPQPQRLAALTALNQIGARTNAAVLGSVVMDPEAPLGLREQAINLLAQANQPESHEQLLKALVAVEARLQTVVAVGLAGGRAGAEKLLAAVTAGKASARLLQERAVEARLAGSGVPGLKEQIAKLTRGLPPADQKLQDLLRKRRAAFLAARTETDLGIKVFEKHCASCHQIANKGARIGPQLDGVGIRGLDRLLEDTLDPHRNVDQAFRMTNLLLKSGRLVSGLLLREEGEVLVMADNQGKEVRVDRGAVDERTVSQLSPMPANFADTIPEAEFYHMMAYLLGQRQPAPGGK